MAELADAPDLGSGGQPCRFKSCYPHNERERQMPLSFVMRITDTIMNTVICKKVIVSCFPDFITQ